MMIAENQPESSERDNNDSNQRFDRRSRSRPDPYEMLVRDPSDIIGLIAYSIFRQKKKKLLEDNSNDRSRFFFFDSTIPQYEEELRSQAVSWYLKFCESIEQEVSRKHINDTREYINFKFNRLIQSQEKFRWFESITASVVVAFLYVVILILVGLFIKFNSELFDIISYAMRIIGIDFGN